MKRSAGLLLYHRPIAGAAEDVEVLIVHMGGPFWQRKDAGAWSIPKGELAEGEDPLAVAEREFEEELGSAPPPGRRLDLGEVTQAGGKRVRVYAVEGDFDADDIRSNTFPLEWPRGSGKLVEFPEVDRAAWVPCDVAREKLVKGQVAFLDRLLEAIRPAS